MDFISKAISYIKKKLGKQAPGLGFLALHIVQKIQTEMPTASGKEKRDKAIAELLDAAKTAGIEAGENAARLLVESAVALVKSKLTSSESAPVPAQPKPTGKKK